MRVSRKAQRLTGCRVCGVYLAKKPAGEGRLKNEIQHSEYKEIYG